MIITGVNGFIGSHLAHALVERGAHVEGISRGTRHPFLGSLGLDGRITVHRADIVAKARVAEIFSRGRYDYVFHLASQSDTWRSTQRPMETFRVNVDGTMNVLEAVRTSRCSPRVVVGGSVRVFQYEALNGHPEAERSRLHPYDASKLAMETMALSYFHAYDIPGAVARNTNIYGPNDLNFSRLIPIIMQGVFRDGRVRLRGDGSLTRDFLYVADAVDGMMRLALHLARDTGHAAAFGFATSRNHTIRRLCQLIRDRSPRHFEMDWDLANPMNDRDQAPQDVSRTREILGWSPTVSLDAGIDHTLRWYGRYLQAGAA